MAWPTTEGGSNTVFLNATHCHKVDITSSQLSAEDVALIEECTQYEAAMNSQEDEEVEIEGIEPRYVPAVFVATTEKKIVLPQLPVVLVVYGIVVLLLFAYWAGLYTRNHNKLY